MDNERDSVPIEDSIVSAIVDPVQCRVLLEKNEVDDGRAKPVNQSDSR